MGRQRPREGQRHAKVNRSGRCLVGGGLGLVVSGRKGLELCVPARPDLGSLGELAGPRQGLDCYLDSLFDPVLSCGDAVGVHRGMCMLGHTRGWGDTGATHSQVACPIWVTLAHSGNSWEQLPRCDTQS